MFIELTDHLRCPADHAESYLVLLPGVMRGREVESGSLGCPGCGRVVPITQGVADFGGGTPFDGGATLGAADAAELLGISGPGGYLGLVGEVCGLAEELAALLPDVGLVLVNPPDRPAFAGAGILRADRLPLKSGSMRGMLLGREPARRADWVSSAVQATLPGRHIVADSAEPAPVALDLLAWSPGCWVAQAPQRSRK